MLEEGAVDVALVSSFELFRAPRLTYAPGCGVVAEGPVESVRLLSRVPIGEIHTLALDTSSLTSVALTKILLTDLYDLAPAYLPAAPDLDAMLSHADAALLIGDKGYRQYDPTLYTLDLGEGWKRLTGLPFVYALWIGYPERITPELSPTCLSARKSGASKTCSLSPKKSLPR